MRDLCSYHCGSCHSHFTSLAAFDGHRYEYECWPDRDHDLRVKTYEGICEMYAEPKTGVALYEHGPRVDQAKAYFGSRGSANRT